MPTGGMEAAVRVVAPAPRFDASSAASAEDEAPAPRRGRAVHLHHAHDVRRDVWCVSWGATNAAYRDVVRVRDVSRPRHPPSVSP